MYVLYFDDLELLDPVGLLNLYNVALLYVLNLASVAHARYVLCIYFV